MLARSEIDLRGYAYRVQLHLWMLTLKRFGMAKMLHSLAVQYRRLECLSSNTELPGQGPGTTMRRQSGIASLSNCWKLRVSKMKRIFKCHESERLAQLGTDMNL